MDIGASRACAPQPVGQSIPWDRTLSKISVLRILVGSGQAMIELITAPSSPSTSAPSASLSCPH
jgi:hypothetical protein